MIATCSPSRRWWAFDVVDVNSNPARFDQKKADAINAEHIRRLEPAEFTGRLQAYFDGHGHDTGLDEAGFAAAAELVQTRIVVLSDAWELLKFFNDDAYDWTPGPPRRNSATTPRRCSTPRSAR
jgi:glutamyl-tRNA synthetase